MFKEKREMNPMIYKYKNNKYLPCVLKMFENIFRTSLKLWIRYFQNNLEQLIGLVGRVSANGPGDMVSIPGCVIPKTLKMVLETSLLNTQQYKVRIKGKVEQSRERSSTLHLGEVAIKKGAFWSPSTTVAN